MKTSENIDYYLLKIYIKVKYKGLWEYNEIKSVIPH